MGWVRAPLSRTTDERLVVAALRRQLAIAKFEELRQGVAPFAEARGWLTDEDVFHAIS